MKKYFLALMTSVGLLLSANAAQATVITFDGLAPVGRGYSVSGNSLDTQGYNFANDCNDFASCILHWGTTSPKNADPGGATYSHNYNNTITTLTKIGGGAFDLTSIDFGNVFDDDPYAQSMQIIGTYMAGGTVVSNITTDALSGLETFLFNWTALSQVTWTETSGRFLQLDNVVVNGGAPQLPEPAPLALLGLGLLGLGLVRRRKS